MTSGNEFRTSLRSSRDGTHRFPAGLASRPSPAHSISSASKGILSLVAAPRNRGLSLARAISDFLLLRRCRSRYLASCVVNRTLPLGLALRRRFRFAVFALTLGLAEAVLARHGLFQKVDQLRV